MNLEKLKNLRRSKGITQAEMAKKLGYKGKSSYCMLENGQIRMPLDTAQKIAEILDVDVKNLFFEKQVQAC